MKLADVNLLVALCEQSHPHHALARRWRADTRFATCPITELGLVRVLMATGLPAKDALDALHDVKRHTDFIPCDEPATVLDGRVTSHRQTTDVYLVKLAHAHGGTLCTLDRGIKGAELVK